MFVDYWWNDNSIELVKINGRIYALYGWNGESYIHCWECADEFTVINESIEYEIIPIYTENEDGEFEIVDYEIRW